MSITSYESRGSSSEFQNPPILDPADLKSSIITLQQRRDTLTPVEQNELRARSGVKDMVERFELMQQNGVLGLMVKHLELQSRAGDDWAKELLQLALAVQSANSASSGHRAA